MSVINIPCRSVIHDMSDGCKQIHCFMNGKLAFVMHYDPSNNTMRELPIPPGMHETQHGSPLDGIETKSMPAIYQDDHA